MLTKCAPLVRIFKKQYKLFDELLDDIDEDF